MKLSQGTKKSRALSFAQFLLTIFLSLKFEAPIDQLREATPFAKIGAVNPLVPLQDHDVDALTQRPSL